MTGLVYHSPEQDVVELRLVFAGDTTVRNWTRYSFNSNYESPTDGWSFTIGDDEIPAELKSGLVPGALVQFTLNGLVQGTGFIDSVTRSITRSGGTEWNIDGRDVFSPVVDAHIDPRLQFKKDMTLEQIVREVFDTFNPAGGEWKYGFDADADHKVKTGRPRSGGGKGNAKRAARLDQLRPGVHEGAFAFVAKLLHRQGLHVFPSVNGAAVLVDQPNYEQEPLHTLVRTSTESNIRDGSVKWSFQDQPSIIVADGYSGGGEFGHSQIMAKMVNPFTGVDQNGQKWPDVKIASDRYPAAKEVFFEGITFGLEEMRWPLHFHTRPLYLHDENARTQEELESFLRREMSLRVRRVLSVTYTVEGHGQYTSDGVFVPYAVDSIVRVMDEPGGINAAMWVLGRTFEKSRSGGTTTRLELIIPGSLQFGEP